MMVSKRKRTQREAQSHEKVVQVAELRRSSASGLHTPKPRKGTRGSRKSRAIAEQMQ